jgi:hypothetical protein
MTDRSRIDAPVSANLKAEFALAARARRRTLSGALREAMAAYIAAAEDEPDALQSRLHR